MSSAPVPAGVPPLASLPDGALVPAAGPAPVAPPDLAPVHERAFRVRRFFNWFPLGLTYAFLYMGRYNLTVSKNALGELMTKEDFGVIFGWGTFTYAIAILLNGPIVDKIGGKRGILIAALGAGLMNLSMGLYLQSVVSSGTASSGQIKLVFSVLYAANMYFQSYGAVAIVKVNAHWFHVRERGGFSGIFGTMISSGIFLAFSVNGWILNFFAGGAVGPGRTLEARWVFFLPAALLLAIACVELLLLKDRPALAGLSDFDTGDASSGDDNDKPPVLLLMKRVITHPVLVTIALIEFCTGVLRNGVMHWYPIYVKEVLALPADHPLQNGGWSWLAVLPFFAVAAVFFGLAARLPARRGPLLASGALVALVPFLQAGWGGILMVAGVIGGNVAGRVSDAFFGSRRAPAAGGLYAVLFLCTVAMGLSMGRATSTLAESRLPELLAGDTLRSVGGAEVTDWVSARRAFACVRAPCVGRAAWDPEKCLCVSDPRGSAGDSPPLASAIAVGVERAGVPLLVQVSDPALRRGPGGALGPRLRAGDSRELAARPVLTLSPYLLGAVMFLLSLSVIGTHGLLSGTATMDFGGRKGAGTAVAMIDGFVYLGTSVQSFALGYLTSRSWAYWPWFLMPFAVIGFLLCLRIWNARPTRAAAGH